MTAVLRDYLDSTLKVRLPNADSVISNYYPQYNNWTKQTAAEVSAGVTPTDYAYQPGDIRRYGAVGDGVTDDSAAIQNAITVASNAASVNKNVYITPGTYFLGSTVNHAANVVLMGEGYGSVFKSTATSNFTMLSLSGAHRASVRGIYFLGNGLGTDPVDPVVGIHIFQSNYIDIGDCFFEAFHHDVRLLDATVNANNSTGTIIHDNHFFSAPAPINGGYGILHVRANNTSIHDNIFGPGPFGRHCIYISAGSTFVDVHDNICRGATLASISSNSGVTAGEALSRINVHHNIILGSGSLTSFGYGINFTGGHTNSQISNNIIDFAADSGIYIQSANGTIVPSNLIIAENTISSSQGIGIALYDGVDCMIINNRLNNNGLNGTDITDIDVANINATSSGCRVHGNKSTSAMRYMIQIGTGVGSTHVSDNDSTSMTRNKVQDNGNATRIFEYQDGWQTASIIAGVVTLDPTQGSNVKVTLNQNVTNFTLTTYGQLSCNPLNIIFTQDSTGGWTVVFDAAVFSNAWSNTGNTANKVSSIQHVSDGTKYQQMGAQMAYH